MAIPKSTFVMGVVTLGLFGVAFYKTVDRKKHAAEYNERADDEYGLDDHDDDEQEDALQRYAKLEEKRVAERAVEAKARALLAKGQTAELKKLFAAEVALPGELFHGVELDGTEHDRTFETRQQEFTALTSSILTTGTGGRFDRFEVFPGAHATREERDGQCGELQTLLGNAWGSPYVDDDGVELWTNKLAGIRASFKRGVQCQLVFERYDEPAAWLNKSGKSTVPYGWIGKPAKQVEVEVGATTEGETIEWLAHGVGAGSEPTKLQAWVANGKITHVIATTVASTPTRAALEEHLRAEFGKPKSEDRGSGNVRIEWPAKNLVVVLSDNGGIAVMNRKP